MPCAPRESKGAPPWVATRPARTHTRNDLGRGNKKEIFATLIYHGANKDVFGSRAGLGRLIDKD